VTVLCCTVTPAAAREAPVDLDTLHRLMQTLQDLARAVVDQYEGWLSPVIGDHLLVMFGVPVVQEDHARRAVQAALVLRQRVHASRERFGGVPGDVLVLRMGLHTGLVVEGSGADTAPTSAVVGNVVSLAVALQAHAEPGQILCSDATARLVQVAVHLETVGLVRVSEQVPAMAAYTVLGSRPRHSRAGQHREQGLSPFVGREREMATLHALLVQVEAGRGQVVGVVGEAGIGKSRLVSEFSRSVEGRRLTYLTGRCLSYGSATPYLLFLDLLRHTCDITETESPEAITTKVHHYLQAVGMASETWAPVFLPLLGVQEERHQLAALSPEARKIRILLAFTQLCLNHSRLRPLILEIEDLHWIDASSEECLAALVERMAGVPLFLLVTYRSGYRPAWLDKSYATQVALPPLSSQDSLRVVQTVLPTAVQSSTPVVAHLLAKAEGNPFFLEELARMVVEQGADVPSSTVPDTVQAVLMARIGRLPAPAKRLLQVAAVIGKDITLPLLQAVADVPEEAMHRDLRRLQAAEFLYETSALPIPLYTFKHILTQEVTYQSLVRHTQQQYHERIAHVLEEQFPEVAETQPEWLAQHYTEAGLPEQALPYWQQAGQHAVERSANVEAISHFMKGLELLKNLPAVPARPRQELELQLAVGSLLRMIKGHTAPEVEQTYMRAYELSQQMGDSLQRVAALVSLARFYLNRAKIQRARDMAEQCFSLAQHVQDPALLQDARCTLGLISFFQGELVTAYAHLEHGIALHYARQDHLRAFSGGIDSGVVCLSVMAWTLWMLGYPEQALSRSREAITLAQKLSHAYSLGFALNYAVLLHIWRREVSLAQEQADAVMALANEYGFIHTLSVGMIRKGWALAMQGAVAEGTKQLHEGLTTLQETETELGIPQHLVLLAEVYRQGGQADEGLHVLDAALIHIDKTWERWPEAESYRLKGECLLAGAGKRHMLQGSKSAADEAAACFHRALDVARRQQAKSLELRAAMSLSRLWQEQGRHVAAQQLLAEIYRGFTEGFETPDLQEAKALLAVLK